MKKELKKKVEWLDKHLTGVFTCPEAYPLTTDLLKKIEHLLNTVEDTVKAGDRLFKDLLEVMTVASAYTDALLEMEGESYGSRAES